MYESLAACKEIRTQQSCWYGL